MKANDDNFIEGVHYYYNENSLLVFTEKYHLQRGFCRGNGCPYNYEKVDEPLRINLLAERKYDTKK